MTLREVDLVDTTAGNIGELYWVSLNCFSLPSGFGSQAMMAFLGHGFLGMSFFRRYNSSYNNISLKDMVLEYRFLDWSFSYKLFLIKSSFYKHPHLLLLKLNPPSHAAQHHATSKLHVVYLAIDIVSIFLQQVKTTG